MSRYLRITLTAIYGVIGLLTLPVPFLSFMLFDAPGSTTSILTILLFIFVALFPILCSVSAIAINLKDLPFRKAFLGLPIVDAVLALFVLLAIDAFCDGSLVC
ncbi:MAG: hypothetical protein HQL45_01160 [Alphaproteobacteria bacterium]|nr:hypothetical protein [Alphaproteobacteria bacterium]